jgi:PilZ domain
MWGTKGNRDRRSFRRKPARWVGHYAPGGQGVASSAPCAIEEVSRHGARVVLYGGLDVEVGDSVVIDVERIGPTSVGFRVAGTVRHVSARDDDGGLRIGVHLALDAPHQQRIAESLFG